MPLYTYECYECKQRFDARQSFNDNPLSECPNCEGAVYRVIQPVGVVFKGSGFYVTDSKGKQNLASAGTKNGNGSAEGGSENGVSASDSASSNGSSTESTKSESATKTTSAETSKSTESA